MRPAALIVCALLLELGWLGTWPLSMMLSHSPMFTASLSERVGLPLASALPLTDSLGAATYVAPATALALLFVAVFAIYVVALVVLHAEGGRALVLWIVLAATLVFQLTLFAMPGLFSQDVFSYIAYGRGTALYGLNPYIWPPSVLQDASVAWVAEAWRTYTSPYGPLWADVQWLLARACQSLSIADQALVYRALANVLLLVNLALAWPLLGRLTPLNARQRMVAFAALAWNPVLLFEIAGNAHNDVLMVTFCLFALLLFGERRRGVASVVALTLGTLVKYLSGVGLIWLAVASAARAPRWFCRLVRPLCLALIASAVAALVVTPWLELPDSLDSLLEETARVGYVNSLPDTLVMMVVTTLTNSTGNGLDLVRLYERALILAAFAVYLVWEANHVWARPDRGSVCRGLARTCLVYVVLVSTSVQTWYFCLPVTVAVLLGLRQPVARLALAYSALALPALYLSYYLREQTPGWVFLVYAIAPLLVIMPELWRATQVMVATAKSPRRDLVTTPTQDLPHVGSSPAETSLG